MAIPKNITKENLIQAAERIISEGIPKNGNSTTYDVLYKTHLLPPKLIVSYANVYSNGEELNRNNFEGGLGSECFRLLEKHGFVIIMKNSFYPELNKFIEQANANNLKTSHFQKEYENLKVKVSFGQGTVARIPWISFLGPNQTTSNGIYPVYLYFKKENLIILSYGISETLAPQNGWQLNENVKTISEYFSENGLKKPDRYGDSYVFSVYDLKKDLDYTRIDKDLSDIISYYKNVLTNTISTSKIEKEIKTILEYKRFKNSSNESGLIFSEKLIIRYISSLCTKPFVLLSGLSGSGKTKLAQSFAKWICENDNQYCIVPVGADWTNREPFLGYPNALNQEEYIKPENGVLDLLLEANRNPEKPYFLILDEMNLSHVERYFADFLSAMESGDAIPLHSAENEISEVPNRINLPKNLFIVGTVNIDETTYMFSPKVLDRANTIEFRIDRKEIEDYLNAPAKINLEKLEGTGVSMAESFVQLSQKEFPSATSNGELKKTLVQFFEELKKSGAEFGYRTAGEIHRLIHQLGEVEKELTAHNKIDIAIIQKLLPKVHGSRRKLEPILTTMASFCVKDGMQVVEDIFEAKEVINFDTHENVIFPLSLEKITRMYKGAIDNGFASYAEA